MKPLPLEDLMKLLDLSVALAMPMGNDQRQPEAAEKNGKQSDCSSKAKRLQLKNPSWI